MGKATAMADNWFRETLHPELQAGIRLEQNYLVTADGVQRLTSFPLEL